VCERDNEAHRGLHSLGGRGAMRRKEASILWEEARDPEANRALLGMVGGVHPGIYASLLPR